MPRHKHADAIIAWANGEEIQYKGNFGMWTDWDSKGQMGPTFHPDSEYRIKPKIVKREGWVNIYRNLSERILWAGAQIYETKEEASKGIHQDFVACIRIEWEEEE